MIYYFYNYIMRKVGFDRQINRFLHSQISASDEHQKIIEFGCGTGITGLTLLQIFPNAELVATDIKDRFLNRLGANAERLKIDDERITLAISDISSPNEVRDLSGEDLSHHEERYDIICAGANIGYASTPESSIAELYELLKPGGIIVNLEMSKRPMGRLISALYGYPMIDQTTFERLAETHGARVTVSKVPMEYFPLSSTRTLILIEKPHTEH